MRWLLALVYLAASPAFAQAPEQPVFGPKVYNHPHNFPSFDIDVFHLPSGVSAPFRLHVRNGQANGQNRVDTAWVFVNGPVSGSTPDWT